MRVTQQLIAEKLNLTQSTVARILNKNPRDTYSEETVKRVMQTARDLGYTITHKRAYTRKALDIACEWEIILDDSGEVYSKGKALIKDISREGMALYNIEVDGSFLPSGAFKVMVFIPEAGLLDFTLRCEIVRLSCPAAKLELGLRFYGLQKKRLKALKEVFDV